MYIFEIDTTVLKSIYSDVDKGLAHVNPILADALGEFPKVFIDKPYKVVISDSRGGFIFEDSYY